MPNSRNNITKQTDTKKEEIYVKVEAPDQKDELLSKFMTLFQTTEKRLSGVDNLAKLAGGYSALQNLKNRNQGVGALAAQIECESVAEFERDSTALFKSYGISTPSELCKLFGISDTSLFFSNANIQETQRLFEDACKSGDNISAENLPINKKR